MRLSLLPCALALLLVGCNRASYTLRYTDPAETTVNYTYELAATSDPSGVKDPKTWPKRLLEPSSMNAQGVMTVTVAAADDKRLTIKTWNKPGTTTGTGFGKTDAEEFLAQGIQYQEYSVDHLRRFLKKDEVQDPMTNTLNGLFPEGPVRVGQTWKYSPFPQDGPATAKFEAEETVAGVKTARIYIDVPSGTSGKTSMTVWIDPTNGRMIKSMIKSEVDQDGMKFNSTFTQVVDPNAETVSHAEYLKQELERKKKEEEAEKARQAEEKKKAAGAAGK